MNGHGRSERVVVTGLGLTTPAGLGVSRNWERITAGDSCAAADPDLEGIRSQLSCRIDGFDATELLGGFAAWRLDRFVQIAIVSTREALADAGWDPESWDGSRVGVVLGNSLGGAATMARQTDAFAAEGPSGVSPMTIPMHMVNMLAGYVAIDCHAGGPNLVTATACASGTTAVGTARDLLRSGACDVVVAGASEAALTRFMVSGLSRMGALSQGNDEPERASRPFDSARDGFVPAEGAGVLVLERERDARARGAHSRAVVAGYGASCDARHITAPDPQARGIRQAVRAALADAGTAASEIEHVNAHGTSTPLNDVTEGKALMSLFPHGPLVNSTKGVIGHPLAAAGAIEAAYAVLAIEHDSVPPTANTTDVDPELDINLVTRRAAEGPVSTAVSTSLGFGGHNAALVLTTP
ncbi:3-oxoacyl-[acyl-carrier-protein] synthase II [Saccharopolyspora lacisalsi]|uniref:3-oxoacyl-[acyl-carrier-protein] synthase II n=1 Tax=Halosaccharopolyspora lacisalsi TaxID=1000566 RepID=A0A839E126_9PSEU|nr:beta-ketoacyl-[acyl-carrier-protein] synthase family protein [Halosaccharopolyspora lacisalsi]MBA8826226.1 3-oxoacyl-[acyl-carrier-protein] synthase II [Halosaccharopolyspora lacisalsi]